MTTDRQAKLRAACANWNALAAFFKNEPHTSDEVMWMINAEGKAKNRRNIMVKLIGRYKSAIGEELTVGYGHDKEGEGLL